MFGSAQLCRLKSNCHFWTKRASRIFPLRFGCVHHSALKLLSLQTIWTWLFFCRAVSSKQKTKDRNTFEFFWEQNYALTTSFHVLNFLNFAQGWYCSFICHDALVFRPPGVWLVHQYDSTWRAGLVTYTWESLLCSEPPVWNCQHRPAPSRPSLEVQLKASHSRRESKFLVLKADFS